MQGDTTQVQSALARWQARLEAMPPVRALGLTLSALDDAHCRLHAPLALHVNDKHCAFGGSLASLMTLAGWTLGSDWMARHVAECDLYVGRSQIDYWKPLYEDLDVEARFADADLLRRAPMKFARDGRARLAITSVVRNRGGEAVATLTARYAARARHC